ncbi:MAG: RIP metalloprotease RseP [Myxococcales bacterium]|nr:RIP metalloprotease RseP [Myxococcales bacterium]
MIPAVTIIPVQYGTAGLVMISVLVVVHELGHFLAAKLFGIGVPVFSIGMGPRLFGYRFRGTDYRVSALPVGGYVQMAGADAFGEEDFHHRVDPDLDFMKKPVWQRVIVMLAGPVFSLLLPFVVFTAVLMAGEPQAAPVVGIVLEGSPAESLGIQAGDRIVTADGEQVEVFSDVFRRLRDAPERPLALGIDRSGAHLDLVLPGGTAEITPDGYVDSESVGMLASSRSTRIGVDDPASPLGLAGIRTGDAIQAVDGADVRTWPELRAALGTSGQHTLKVFRAERDKEPVTLELTVSASEWTPASDDVWANPWGAAPIMLYVGRVSPGGAAEEAGLQSSDRLWSIDGRPVQSWTDLRKLVGASMDGRTEAEGPRSIDLVVMRGQERIPLTLTPRLTREIVRGEPRFRPLMGVERYPSAYVDGPTAQKYYSFTEAVPMAVRQGGEVMRLIFGVLYSLVTGNLKPQEAVGGPVAIFQAAGESAQSGLHSFARTLGTISFSLGIVNLLPVPMLDGGQIVFYTLEGIRGRPLSVRLRERIQVVGVLGLIALMLMVTVMDVNRWLSG